MDFEIKFGSQSLHVAVPDDKVVPLHAAMLPPSAIDKEFALKTALESPRDFPALRRALTPDDRVAIVVDGEVSNADRILTLLVEYLKGVGISADAISILLISGPNPPGHETIRPDPVDQTSMSYLATTKAGHRVYLNRLALDADQMIVVSGVRYDANGEIAGGDRTLIMGLADAETRERLRDSDDEISELSWLLGAPFAIYFVEGAGDEIADLFAGTRNNFAVAAKLAESLWSATAAQKADLVIAAIELPPDRQTWSDVIQAAIHAEALLEEGGRIAVLSAGQLPLSLTFRRAMESDSPMAAIQSLKGDLSEEANLTRRWLRLVKRSQVALYADLSADHIESLFAMPLQKASQVQRLIDAAKSCVVVPDAQRRMVRVSTLEEKQK